jgi:hypothetical protein
VVSFDVVIPTVGRASLTPLLDALLDGPGPEPAQVVVVDDRVGATQPLIEGPLSQGVVVLASGGRGPAGARNLGWRSGSAEWVAFLDDDVVPPPGWRAALAADLEGLPDHVAASQGRIVVPPPEGRRPTDWERNVAGLESAQWATADMAYRRVALAAVGGFDERFRRAYREDADLGARVVGAGWRIVTGDRQCLHPVRPADRWVSVRLQAGNADDALLRALHGRRWRQVTGVAPGRRARHVGVTIAGTAAVVGALTRRRPLAVAGAAAWAVGTAELAWARIAPGPGTRQEILTMALTSAAIPPAATWHWLRGWATLPHRLRHRPPAPPAPVAFSCPTGPLAPRRSPPPPR